jgi:hypothetical protein
MNAAEYSTAVHGLRVAAGRSLELLFTEMRRRYPRGAGPAVQS